MDKRPVLMISSLHWAGLVGTGEKDRHSEAVMKLTTISDYNHYMGWSWQDWWACWFLFQFWEVNQMVQESSSSLFRGSNAKCTYSVLDSWTSTPQIVASWLSHCSRLELLDECQLEVQDAEAMDKLTVVISWRVSNWCKCRTLQEMCCVSEARCKKGEPFSVYDLR